MVQIMKYKTIYFLFSGVLFVASVLLLATVGLKPGIDFSGGSLLEVSFVGPMPTREAVEDAVEETNVGTPQVQQVGETGYIIKLPFLNEDQHQVVFKKLSDTFSQEKNVVEERFETIGPAISREIVSRAWQVGLLVLLAVILFVAYAFRRVSKPVASWKYGIIAVIALIHDVVITMGAFVLLGTYANVEVGIPFVVALLTILGYSVNDTIVVFDRIRENLIRRPAPTFAETVETGLRETIARSLITSLATLLVLIALYAFGGESVRYFALALIIGMSFGAYSSIFLASPLLVAAESWKRK